MSSFERFHFELSQEIGERLRYPPVYAETPLSETALALALCGSIHPEISKRKNLVLVSDEASAASLTKAIAFFSPEMEGKTFFLPDFGVSPYAGVFPNVRRISERCAFLSRALSPKDSGIFIATPQSFCLKTMPVGLFKEVTQTLLPGSEIPANFSERLIELGYSTSSLVEDIGSFAVRGGIIDIFPPSSSLPVRIELFGDDVDRIHLFDPQTQRVVSESYEVTICPAREIVLTSQVKDRLIDASASSHIRLGEETLHSQVRQIQHGHFFHGIDFLLPFSYEPAGSPLDFFSSPFNTWFFSERNLRAAHNEVIALESAAHKADRLSMGLPAPSGYYNSFDDFLENPKSRRIFVNPLLANDPTEHLSSQISQIPRPSWDRLLKLSKNGTKLIIGANSTVLKQQISHEVRRRGFVPIETNDLRAALNEENPIVVRIIGRTLSESLLLERENIAFLCGSALLGKRGEKSRSSQRASLAKETRALQASEISAGSLVTHVVHGIGVFNGLKTLTAAGITEEFLEIGYRDDDKLFVPVYKTSQIYRYAGPSGHKPLLDKLGGQSFEKVKTRVRGHLKDIAADLLKLYAERKRITRPPFAPGGPIYKELENSFPYVETDDQLSAITDIFSDFQQTTPMDRLLCGDVGFGKTEVAMRAAFRAVLEKKQVAVLVPTTTLAFQHHHTFTRRMAGWPVTIKSITRFTPKKEVRETQELLRDGKVDILIGTHAILSSAVQFKNLGFLVIDEEHRFGVTQKEKLRKLKVDVDTLAMTATPIPRTLNMAFSGLRDISIITTPPQDRLPVKTFVSEWNDGLISEAVTRELDRDGQVFVVHNRIQSIPSVHERLKKLLPHARIAVGHGQLPEKELERLFLAFMQHEYDVLLSTAIIESGIDIPRANTIIIDQAQIMGLSQLHQLRGRVGRSAERAFCYLIIPSSKALDRDASERLRAIQQNEELGSGLRLAKLDLELRGAGNLLGEEQSGHVRSVGYDLFVDLLYEAISSKKGTPRRLEERDPDIHTGIPAFLPDTYVPDVRLRLAFYQKLSEVESESDVMEVEEELKERFGSLPEEGVNLLTTMWLRRQCQELRVKELRLGPKNLSLSLFSGAPLGATIPRLLASRTDLRLEPPDKLIISGVERTLSGINAEIQRLLTFVETGQNSNANPAPI